MGFFRNQFELLKMSSVAYAKWEYEVSTNIIKSRKRLIILGILLIPCIIGLSVSFAELPEYLGGKYSYMPSFYSPSIFMVSIIIGMAAGLITGCIGAGGGFIITPALMSAGIKGILAVGTDLFHIFAKAIMGTVIHKKLGNVSVGLAIAFLVGAVAGVTGGGVVNRTLYEINPVLSDTFISIVFVVLLGFLGFYSMLDFLKQRKVDVVDVHGGSGGHSEKAGKPTLASKLQSVNAPPMIKFDEDLTPGGKKISGWFVAVCGGFVGFVAAIMGVGGGFLTFPIFVYLMGVSSFTTIGTDILQIIFTAGYASITQYAIYGFIFYTLAMGMLLGSLIGIQIGALTTKVVKGIYIRGFYAITILGGFINRLFALPEQLGQMGYIPISPALGSNLTMLGNWLFFGVIGCFGVWVFYMFFTNMKTLRGEE
ncbi:MAG: sulfite exporter TauE/SafE family protein [Desulfonatronovibrio sp.]